MRKKVRETRKARLRRLGKEIIKNLRYDRRRIRERELRAARRNRRTARKRNKK